MQDPIPYSPERIINEFLTSDRRVLLFGESGTGKSTLAASLAQTLSLRRRSCSCIGADPGSPAFGIPGAVCLGLWKDDTWQLSGIEALCTLDSGRFRLPLVSAVRRLSAGINQGTMLVDAPGVVRNVAGAELLVGLVEAGAIDTVVVLCRVNKDIPLRNELATSGCRILPVLADAEARCLTHRMRARLRTRLWDEYLQQGCTRVVPCSERQLTGTPPPLDDERHWQGRQIALLRGGETIAMGEIIRKENTIFHIRSVAPREAYDQILCRDACRNRQGFLATAKPAGTLTLHYIPPPDMTPFPALGKTTGPIPIAQVGKATATLINGIFGDPLLHLRLHNRKKSILFDLGEGNRLPARIAHQVSHVFISHAHIDHISGFFWLMRSRIGNFPPCSLFGPPGLAAHVTGLLNGIHWDRIGDWGPRFIIAEFHGGNLVLHELQAGNESEKYLGEKTVQNGLILDKPDFRVWAAMLDHGGIPVLAYKLEQAPRLNVRKNLLTSLDMTPGPWLRKLKDAITSGDRTLPVRLPDGTSRWSGELGDTLLQVTPAQKLVYATDIADTHGNRKKLEHLAAGAHVLFCESAFIEADRNYAERSGHLTTHACADIAQAAGVECLVPFHFSRRYESEPFKIYDEIKLYYPRVLLPKLHQFFQV